MMNKSGAFNKATRLLRRVTKIDRAQRLVIKKLFPFPDFVQ